MSITVQVHGLKEFSMALQELPKKLQGKTLGAAVKAGADLVRDQTRANAPVDTEAVKKSIVAYARRGNRPDDITYEVGVTQKKRYPRRTSGKGRWKGLFKVKFVRGPVRDVMWPAFWWRFNEFGTAKMAAKPFLRPAWDAQKGYALRMIKAMLKRAIPIAVASLPKYTGSG